MAMITFWILLILECYAEVLANENSTWAPSNSTEQRVDVAADNLFDEYWKMWLMDDPEFATTLGNHQYDDKLSGYSLMCFEKRKVMMTEFLERANQLLPLAQPDSDTYDNIELFIAMLQYKIDQFMSGSHLFPLSILYTPQMALRYMQKYIQLEEAKNYWDLISRYRKYPQQIDEQIELMREGIRTNLTFHEISLWTPSKGEKNQSTTESPYYKPFLKFPSSIPTEEVYHIQQNATDAIENSILPALQKMDDFMETEYRPNTRPEIGVGSLPGGRDFYRHELVHYLSDNGVTAEEIHSMGVAEVERIAKEMEEVIESLGFNMTRQEFSNRLRTDESQFFESEEEALNTYRSIIENEITPKLSLLFKYIPEKVLKVEKIDSDISSGPRAYYMPASPDNSTAAVFYLDVTSLKNLPRYEVMTLAMHEGVPGHHFQKSYTMEQDDVPEFRKHGISNSAYTEGWALYAEYLGYELGLYEDPYMRYGHLSEEIFRACRMVVDTGMHVFGWSRQRAIDYMMNYSAATLDNIEREVDRYITWPGQACAYKYGEMKIKDLRKKAETTLGPRFDIRDFHDTILRYSAPMELVAKQVDRYIERTNNAVTDN